MARQSLQAKDYRAIARLSHECRDLGDDPHAWRMHLAEQLHRLVASDLVFVVEMDLGLDGSPHALGATEWGWRRGFDRRGWETAIRLFAENPRYAVFMGAFVPHLVESKGQATFARTDLLTADQWEGSVEREQVYRVIDLDHTVFSFHALSDATPGYAGLMCPRAFGERDYSVREKRLLDEVQRTITPLVGQSLCRFREPSFANLAPRVRQVLECLLEGDGDKQIARRLGISGYTVNQYTKVIYRHFGVRGRAELMARWVRRGWGKGFTLSQTT